MCSNYKIPKRTAFIQLGIEVNAMDPDIKSHVYPLYPAPIIVKEFDLDFGKFGLIPKWAKDTKFGTHTYNARTETVAEKPSFRHDEIENVDGVRGGSARGRRGNAVVGDARAGQSARVRAANLHGARRKADRARSAVPRSYAPHFRQARDDEHRLLGAPGRTGLAEHAHLHHFAPEPRGGEEELGRLRRRSGMAESLRGVAERRPHRDQGRLRVHGCARLFSHQVRFV